jgi:tRNA (guanine37-N1)-methyltransferase
MRIDLLTLFPEACEPFFAASLIGKARQSGLVDINCHNIRGYTEERHGKVDDRPFGGGPGMVLMCQPVFDAVEAVDNLAPQRAERILLTPAGEPFTQQVARELSKQNRLMLIAGHYEGFDDRIRQGLNCREISIGDYVLSGGEAAAMVLIDAVVRLIPGVVGDGESIEEESFSPMGVDKADDESHDGSRDLLLEYPHFTRPRVFRGMEVPEVLVSGDHGKIRQWRTHQAKERTAQRRPDLL